MRNAAVNTLFDIARKDKKIILITGDLGYGVLDEYKEELKEQFINAGISEQNISSLAAGMAHGGLKPITYSIGNFNTLRCIEQIRNDICYHNMNVKIISIGAGMAYGGAGITHHLVEDISMIRSIPDIVIFSPCDKKEAELCVKLAYSFNGPCYIRLGKGGERLIHKSEIKDIQIGDMIEINKGKDICIFTTSAIISEVVDAYEELREKYNINAGIVSFPTIKPINKEKLEKIVKKYNSILTVEEHILNGGFGSIILENINDMGIINKKIIRIGINDSFTSEIGSQDYLRQCYKIDKKSIIEIIYNEVRKV